MGLTAVAIKAAKGRDKQYKMSDSGGLYLIVTPSLSRPASISIFAAMIRC